MELWIRSQDRRTLIQPNRIDIDDKSIIVWQNNYNCDETYLGIYKTKERALEVLDEIQRILQPRLIANVRATEERATEEMEKLIGSMSVGKTLKQDIDIKQLSTYVYEMPKE